MKNLKWTFMALVFAGLFACNSGTTETMDNAMEEEIEETHQAPEINTNVEIKEGQRVYFPNLEDGQEIELPYYVEFGVEGMEVEPAGVVNADKGHHHILVNEDPIAAGKMVPMNETNKHFGGGQLGDTLTLEKYPTLTPGEHTLTLQFADGIHASYGEKMSATVKVTVK